MASLIVLLAVRTDAYYKMPSSRTRDLTMTDVNIDSHDGGKRALHASFAEARTAHAGARDSGLPRARRGVRFVPMSIQPLPIKRPYSSGRRRELIAVAAELFLQHSYDAVTIEIIAARAGITGPGL